MTEYLQTAVQHLQERFDGQVQQFQDEISLTISSEHIVAVCQSLRDDYDFNLLADITAVDYWPQEDPRFHVVYQLHSLPRNISLSLRVPLPGQRASVPTIESVYPNANWSEREIWDMFGIHIEDHSDLRRILMPYDWEGHPLRKDYPLGYEEVQFSFNFDEIDLRKPYVDE